jgi:hypothetical protein
MKLILFEEDEFYKKDYPKECYNYIIFETKCFALSWFTEFDEWFIYIVLGKKYWRFSSAGYLKGRSE